MDQVLLAPRPAHVPPERVVDWDMYSPPGVEEDFHRAWARLLADDVPDVVWTPRNGGHWIAARGELIHEIYGDYKRFSNRIIMVPKEVGEEHHLLPTTLDPPAHRPFRTLLNENLAPKAIRGLEEKIREQAVDLIESFRSQGHCDFISQYSAEFPIRIFMSVVDLPMTDAPRLKYLTDQITRPDGSMTLVEAKQQYFDYLGPIVDARMGADGTDMLSRLVNGVVDGRPLNRTEALEITTQIIIAGLDTVVNFLGFVMQFLATDNEHRRQLVANPDLIPAAVEELIRRYPLVTVAREVREDMEFAGVALKAGEMILIPSPLHGIDPRTNKDPFKFDLNRTDSAHTTFGNGPHRCPGANLARTEIRVTMEEWLARIPEFEIEPGFKVKYHGGIVGCVDKLPLVWKS